MAKYVLAISKDIEKLSKRVDETNVVVKYDTCKKIISDLKATLKANPKLVALAAPQIGYNERIFCLKCLDGKIKAFAKIMGDLIKEQKKIKIEEKKKEPDKQEEI